MLIAAGRVSPWRGGAPTVQRHAHRGGGTLAAARAHAVLIVTTTIGLSHQRLTGQRGRGDLTLRIS